MPGQSRRQSLGKRGETLAADYLRRLGYTVVETNYRCQWGEVDIVAQEGDTLVFVEVRTRRGASFGAPQESLTPRKRQRLISTAETYLQAHPDAPADWRIDLISLTPHSSGPLHIEHLPNAVQLD